MIERRRLTRPTALIALAILATVALGACSSSGPDDATVDSTVESTSTTGAAATGGVPVSTTPRPSCDANNLNAAAAGPLPGAALSQIVCEPSFAVATWSTGPNGETAVLFALQGGAWVYVGSGPAEGDVVALAPAEFSATAIPSWQRLRVSLANREGGASGEGRTTGGGGGGGRPTSTVYVTDPDTGGTESCVTNGDGLICTPAPAPPVTSDDPDAPPAPPVTSNFCRYNFNDTRCVDSNQQYTPR